MINIKKVCAVISAVTLSAAALGCGGAQPDNTQNPDLVPVHVVVLCGQSNAVGYSGLSYLADTEYSAMQYAYYPDVRINFNGEGANTVSPLFRQTEGGLGTNKQSFGPELGMAKVFSESEYAGNTYIIKYAVGGTGLDPRNGDNYAQTMGIQPRYWNAPNSAIGDCSKAGSLYVNLCERIDAALATLQKMNFRPTIEALCWMQGEHDSAHPSRYSALEVDFITQLREKYKDYCDDDGMAFIDGGITPYWTNYSNLNSQKKMTCVTVPNAEYIDVVQMQLEYKNEPANSPDYAHLDATSMIKLGLAFGENALKYFD